MVVVVTQLVVVEKHINFTAPKIENNNSNYGSGSNYQF
jgi:hypothetical protein